MPDNPKHIIFNGEIVFSDVPHLFHNNRGFCYGDGIFETMHAFGTEIQFVDAHFERLYKGLKTLKIEVSETIAQQKIVREIVRLLNIEKLFNGVRLRLAVYRNSEGFYSPKQNLPAYIIACSSLENGHFELNHKGQSIDIFKEITKPVNSFSSFKTANSLVNTMAGIWTKEHGLDDCLILNDKGQIIEGFHSNLFIVKDNQIYTPSLILGCVNGIMRNQVLYAAQELGFATNENIQVSESALLDADEIFLTNAIEGIRWVGAFRQRRYFNKTAKLLCEQLNKQAFTN